MRIALWIGGAAAPGCTPFESDTAEAGFEVDASGVTVLDDSGPATRSAEPASRCDPNTPFGPPTFVSNLSSVALWLGGLRLSGDSLTAYFQARGVPGRALENFDIYTATRAQLSLPFSDVAPLEGGINTSQHETEPSVSGDGLLLVFARSPLGQLARLYYATRTVASGPFTLVGPVFASGYGDAPFLRADGKVLYLMEQDDGATGWDVYRSTRGDSGFDPPVRLPEINSTFDDLYPVVTSDDLTLYFASNRSSEDAAAHLGIWMATRPTPNADFSAPTPVAELDVAGTDVTPTFITGDGCALYFMTSSPVAPFNIFYVAEKQGH